MKALKTIASYIFKFLVALLVTYLVCFIGLSYYYKTFLFLSWPEPTAGVQWVLFFAFNTVFAIVESIFPDSGEATKEAKKNLKK